MKALFASERFPSVNFEQEFVLQKLCGSKVGKSYFWFFSKSLKVTYALIKHVSFLKLKS